MSQSATFDSPKATSLMKQCVSLTQADTMISFIQPDHLFHIWYYDLRQFKHGTLHFMHYFSLKPAINHSWLRLFKECCFELCFLCLAYAETGRREDPVWCTFAFVLEGRTPASEGDADSNQSLFQMSSNEVIPRHVNADLSGRGRDTIHTIRTHCAIKMISNILFQGLKNSYVNSLNRNVFWINFVSEIRID